MLLKETIREAVSSLWSSKQRTLLALLGIVIGIGSVIAMVSIGEVAKHESLKQFAEMGTDLISVSGSSYSSDNDAEFKLQDVLAVPEYCSAVAQIAPYTGSAARAKIGGKPISLPLLGVTNIFFNLCKLNITQGRALSDLDVTMSFCVITHEVHEKFLKAGVTDVIGHKFLLMGRLFIIVGVLEKVAPNMMRPSELSEGVLIPLSTALRVDEGGKLMNMIAKLTPGQGWETAKDQVTSYFQFRAKDLPIHVRNPEELLRQVEKQMQLLTLLLGAVGSISLVVGGVGVMNVMLVSVSERRREIGIRRALGARRSNIQFQFIIESICLCLAGGIFGVILGSGACYVLTKFNGWEFMISWMAIWLGVSVSCLVGLFFGYYPASQAAKLSPIVALRSD